MVSAFWNIPGIQSHQSLEFLERSLAPLCIYDKRGQTIYASQSFLALLHVGEDVDFFAYFRSKSTPHTLLTSLWNSALQGETVNFLAKPQDDQRDIECSLSFNQATHSMFLTVKKSELDPSVHRALQRHERAVSLVAHPHLATALVNQDGIMIKCNPKFHALLQTDEHETLLLDALVHPNDRLIDAALKQKLLDGVVNSYTVEKRFMARNRDIVWMNVSVSLNEVADGDDRQRYFEYVLDDLTERRKVYSALVRTEEKWKALILNSPYLFIQTSSTGQIVYTSAAVEQLLGYKEEELLGRHVTELLHPNHFNEFELVLQLWASDASPQHSEIECWWRAKSGRWVALYVRGQRFPSALDVDGVMLSGHNITDRKCLEMELQASEERFRSLVLNLPGAAFRCNAVYTMTFMSDGVEAIAGYPAAALMNNQARSFLGIVHPDDIALLKDSLIQSVLDCRRCSIEYRLIHANGQIRWVSERKQGIFDQHGNLLWLDGVLIDISDRKQAEAELRRSEAVNQAILQQCPDLVRANAP